jgi:hypothetical protein
MEPSPATPPDVELIPATPLPAPPELFEPAVAAALPEAPSPAVPCGLPLEACGTPLVSEQEAITRKLGKNRHETTRLNVMVTMG